MSEPNDMDIAIFESVCSDYGSIDEIAGYREHCVKVERERIRAKLEAFQTSCEGYMTKAVWRELDALVVELGGEHRPYKFT